MVGTFTPVCSASAPIGIDFDTTLLLLQSLEDVGTAPTRNEEGAPMSEACEGPGAQVTLAAAGEAPKSPRRTRYRVSGMDCASCAAKIDTGLRRLPGTL